MIDGHDLAAIDRALSKARSGPDRPSVIVARTIKAKGVPELEDRLAGTARPYRPNGRRAPSPLWRADRLHIARRAPRTRLAGYHARTQRPDHLARVSARGRR